MLRLSILALILCTSCAIKIPVSGGATIKYEVSIDNLIADFEKACRAELPPDATEYDVQHCIDVYLNNFLALFGKNGVVLK